LIYLYLGKHEFFFRQFTVKKTRLLLPAVRLSCLYIQWFAYMDAICKESLWKKMCLRAEISCIPLGNKGFVSVLVYFCPPKNKFPTKTIHQLAISDVKMLLLTGKIGKADKARNCFCLLDRRNSRYILHRLFITFYISTRGITTCKKTKPDSDTFSNA